MIVVVYCIAGLHITEPDYRLYFSWTGFLALHIIVIALLFGCIVRTKEDSFQQESDGR
jgi:hypothetical protein